MVLTLIDIMWYTFSIEKKLNKRIWGRWKNEKIYKCK